MFIQNKRKLIVSILLTGCVAVASLAFTPKDVQPRKRNLKVLPENISHDSLDHIMDGFKLSLGVKCNYCHAPSKDNPRKLDMASDDNPKKDIARDMMRMNYEINQKYVSLIPHPDTATETMVTCNTCHRGESKPSAK
jgi:hypothetical protein